MALWLLRPIGHPERADPWSDYDVADGFVVSARTEIQARQLAAAKHGHEGAAVWLSFLDTACYRLPQPGAGPHVVLRDFRAG